MIDFKQEEIVREFKEFVDAEIRPIAADIDRNGQFPRSIIEKLGRKGYFGICISPEYGGLGLNQVNYGKAIEIVGKACSSTRSLLTVQTSLLGETIGKFGTKEQKARWLTSLVKGEIIGAFALTEPLTGSDAQNVTTTYSENGSRYILQGKKKWITFGDIADLFLVVANNEKTGISTFLVERNFQGVKTTPIHGLLGVRGSHIAEIVFDNVEVPEENLLGPLGNGFTYTVTAALNNGRYCVACGGLAIAQEALEAIVWYTRHRKQFGDTIYKNQSIKRIISEITANVHAARVLCSNAGKLRDENHMDSINETIIAKYFSSKIAMSAATDAVQVFGGNGCYDYYPVERLFREAKILEIIEGTSQIIEEIIAMNSLRKYYNKNYFKNNFNAGY